MNYNYISKKINHYFVLIFGLLFFTSKMGAQLPVPPVIATSNVPEASQYGVMYKLDIPNNGNYASALTYAINNSTVTGLSYNRVAYFLQLDSKWVWVSMNKFNTTNDQLGIPYMNSGIVFQQKVNNMNVYSSVGAGVTNTVNASGNIEIWPDCYSQGLGLGTIGGNGGTYDFNDTQNPSSNCYGSFQIHNYEASETIFAYNSFTNGNDDDLGIGNNTGNGNPDWTFMYNAANYATKTLYILVDQGINIITQPSSLTVSACKNGTTTPLTTSVSVTTGTVTNYTWYSNTINSNSGGTVVASNSSSLTTNSYTPSTTTVGTLYYYCVITSSTGGNVTTNPSGAITVNTLPIIAVNSGSICTGQSFTMIPSGASTYTYTGGSSIVSPVTNSSYTVTGTSAQGCVSASGAVSSVTVNTLPIIAVNSGLICAGQSFTMIPSGASTYTYTGGSSIVSPVTNSSYTVTGTSAQGCVSASGAVSSVTVNTLPIIAVNSGSICAGESFTLVPTGAVSYTYSNGSDVLTPITTDSYTVTGTDANGCESSIGAVSTITVNALPTITVISASICAGSTGTLTASGANTYTWNTGANTSVILDNPLTTTVYDVTGTSSEGCLGSLVTATISVGTAPSIVVNSASVCAGSSATLTANGVTTYTWSTGDNTSSIVVTPSVNTVYSVDGELIGCGVLANNTATVIVNDLPVITVNSGVICEGESFTITANGADTYTYSGGSSVVMPITTSSYTVSGTSLEGCLNSIDAISTVSVNALPVVSLSSSLPSNTICVNGSFVTLTGLPIGGVYSGTNISGNTFDPISTGTYTPVYSYTDAVTGCVNSSLVSITVDVCSGIKEATISIGTVKLFPNPNNGLFSIETISNENKTIIVTDVTGRVVLSEVSNELLFSVDMKNLANGLYYVSIISTNSVEIVKIVKE